MAPLVFVHVQNLPLDCWVLNIALHNPIALVGAELLQNEALDVRRDLLVESVPLPLVSEGVQREQGGVVLDLHLPSKLVDKRLLALECDL